MGDGGEEGGSPLISGRSEQRSKETGSSGEDCKQGMHSIPSGSTRAGESGRQTKERQKEEEKLSRLS